MSGLMGRVATTPARLRAIAVIVVLLALASGVTSILTLRQRADLVQQMRGTGSVPGLSALDIYLALSDADASAASAFLAGGPDQAAQRARYEGDIARAGAAITVASRSAVGAESVTALATLSSGLPVYTGLVDSARAIDRQGLPLGVAYLREASGLMRNTLLPAAERVYQAELGRVARAQPPATLFPWPAVTLGVLTLGALLLAQVYLTRRTHRLVNVGLAVATLAALASLFWVADATARVTRDVQAARRDGLAQVQLLAQIQKYASRGRADEALTLLAHGNGQAFEQDFQDTMVELTGADGSGGLLAQVRDGARDAGQREVVEAAQQRARAWIYLHQQVRDLDDVGQYADAARRATGTDPTGGATLFGALTTSLNQGLDGGGGRFEAEISRAAGDVAGSDVLVGVLTGLLILGVLVGLQQRVAEYR